MLPFLLDAYQKAYKKPGGRKGTSSGARATQGSSEAEGYLRRSQALTKALTVAGSSLRI